MSGFAVSTVALARPGLPHARGASMRIALAALALAAIAPLAEAAKFPPVGGRGDRAEEVVCPPGHVLSGLYGRTGAWIDQIGLICSRVNPDFSTGTKVRSAPKGGSGGSPTEMECDPGGGVREIIFLHQGVIDDDSMKFVPKRVRLVQLLCQKPKDGSDAGRARWFGGEPRAEGVRELQAGVRHACPGNEYAIGLAVHHGRDVNAIGLICGQVVAASAPFSGALEAFARVGGAPGDDSMELGTDRPGSDYDRFNTDEPEGCRKECQHQSDRCRAWTFVRPGVQGPRGLCYLKSSAPAPQANECCVSGVPKKVVGLGKKQPTDPTLERDVDRPGSDILRFVLDAADPKVCQARCNNLGRCSAWTFVRPGVQDAKAVCYLKDMVPAAVSNACCVSGVKSE